MIVAEKGYKPVSSVVYSNKEAIENIMKLHGIEQFDLDCTYSKGAFYKGIIEPKMKSDLFPLSEDVIQADSRDLHFLEDGSIESMMVDPPFVIVGSGFDKNKGEGSITAKRFSGYADYEALKNHYIGTIRESYRVLKDKGLLVFKCQDTVSGGKNHFTHNLVMQMALFCGFYPKDLIVLVSNKRVNAFNGSKWKNQHHARKYHSYFWVFEKKKCKVNYDFWKIPPKNIWNCQ